MYKDVRKQKEAQHRGYLRNKSRVLNRNTVRRLERRQWMAEFLADKKCLDCGENNPICLDFHHTNPKTKVDGVTKMLYEFRSLKSVLKEIKKCVIVCANCHRKRHAAK